MNKYQDVVMPFRPEMAQQLQSRVVSVRADTIRQLDRTNFTPEQAALIFPIAASLFAKETPKVRKRLAVLCVKTAEKASDVPGLMEYLTLDLKEAKTRDNKRRIFIFLQLASTKGWDITLAVPPLLEEVSTQWSTHALRTLTQAARSGIDVLDFDTPDGMQAWEIFRLTLELSKSYDIRYEILGVLTELARHRAAHLEKFPSLVEKQANDTRMSQDYRRRAAACLAAFREAGIEPD